MMPIYLQRRKRRKTTQTDEAGAAPNLSGEGQAPGIEMLERSGADAGQWDSAYQQLFDRN
jgi:hypothetical protein